MVNPKINHKPRNVGNFYVTNQNFYLRIKILYRDCFGYLNLNSTKISKKNFLVSLLL